MSDKLDRLVAERVMGWTVNRERDERWNVPLDSTYFKVWDQTTTKNAPWFSKTMSHAWEVVEHLRKQTNDDGSCRWLVSLIDHQHKWEAVVHEIGMDDIACECDESAQMAICLAALRAVGVPESEIQEAMR